MRPRSCVYLASSEKSSDLALMNPPLKWRSGLARPTHGMREAEPKQLRTARAGRASPAGLGSCRILPPEQRTEVRPEVVDDLAIAFGGGMDAVQLIQPGIASYSIQKERHQRRAALPGHPLVQALELGAVARAVIGRQPHARDEDARPGRLKAPHELIEIGAHGVQVLAAEGVVGTEFQDHDLGPEAQRPVYTAEPAGRRIAGDARIDHAIGIALGPEIGRASCRERV